MDDIDELDAWLRELCVALELPPSLAAHRALVLDVARDAAHGVMRPAAPLTTFLVGYAAASAGSRHTGDPVEGAAATASALALARLSQAGQTESEA